MSALAIYQSLRGIDRINARTRILSLAGLKLNRSLTDVLGADPETVGAELSDEAEAFVATAIREWWLANTNLYHIWTRLDSCDARAKEREIAILLCAESVSSASDNPSVSNCRSVRLQFVIGSASEADRAYAIELCGAVAKRLPPNDTDSRAAASAAVSDSVHSAISNVSWYATWRTQRDQVPYILASALKKLYPDPTRLDWMDAMTRWDTTATEMRRAMIAIGVAKP